MHALLMNLTRAHCADRALSYWTGTVRSNIYMYVGWTVIIVLQATE